MLCWNRNGIFGQWSQKHSFGWMETWWIRADSANTKHSVCVFLCVYNLYICVSLNMIRTTSPPRGTRPVWWLGESLPNTQWVSHSNSLVGSWSCLWCWMAGSAWECCLFSSWPIHFKTKIKTLYNQTKGMFVSHTHFSFPLPFPSACFSLSPNWIDCSFPHQPTVRV